MDTPPVPQANLAVYGHLHIIENTLRELIIEVMEHAAGPAWHKSRLPGDLLQKYRRSVTEARRTRWTRLVPHHPIYYLDFADLEKVLLRDDNWRDAFEFIFRRKDILRGYMAELSPLRNTVAHNRKNSDLDQRLAKMKLDQLSNVLGHERFRRLSRTSTVRLDIPSVLSALLGEAQVSLFSALACEPLRPLSHWPRVRGQWWFDESYLGRDPDAVSRYFAILEEYSQLPRERGTGYLIESWIRDRQLELESSKASERLLEILGEVGADND